LLASDYVKEALLDEKLVDIVAKVPMKKKTMINFAHLFIAMDLGYYFLSGDDAAIKVIKKEKLYDKTISYIDLRKMLS
jgi:hypothetical protein